MKKIKWFTLLETLLVIAIIGIVSVSLINFRKNVWQDHTDIAREAINIIYKEMNQYIKDFQRNKVREDDFGFTHEISYLYFEFGASWTTTGNNLSLGNLYIYESWWITLWHTEEMTLISGQAYSAFQVLKWTDKYNFFLVIENNNEILSPLFISNNWQILHWTWINDAINGTLQNLGSNTITFLICSWEGNSPHNPVWIISINAITKATNLELCETEKYAWINCDSFANCN